MGFLKRAVRLHRSYDRDEKEAMIPSFFDKPSQASLISTVPLSPTKFYTMPAAPDPNVDPVAYLRSIHSVRDRSKVIMRKAEDRQLSHFDVDYSKFESTAQYIVSIIKVSSLL